MLNLLLRLIPATIMLQTLFYKFSAAPEPVHIFTLLLGKYESIGRIGTGIMELFAGVLLLKKRSALWGAIIGAGTMFGAILSHLFIVGITVQYLNEKHLSINDNGSLFISALITVTCCLYIIYTEREEVKHIMKIK